jgi:hypothetical protein
MAVAYASPRYRETTFQDFVALDSVSRRFAVTGREVQPLPADLQITPTAVDTAGVVGPTVAPVPVALPSGGSLTAGLYSLATSYTTALGETECSPLGAVTVVANGRITRPAIALPTNVTGLKDYLSVGPLSADIRLVGTAATGAAAIYTAAPTTAAAMPLLDFTPLATLGPVYPLEAAVGLDELANTALSVLTVTTPPTAGQRFRFAFTRRPAVPSAGSDVINLPEEWIRVVAVYYACQFLMLNHQAGDSTRFGAVAAALAPLAEELLNKSASRDLPRINATSWAV